MLSILCFKNKTLMIHFLTNLLQESIKTPLFPILEISGLPGNITFTLGQFADGRGWRICVQWIIIH